MKLKSILLLPLVIIYFGLNAQTSDTIKTTNGKLIIHFLGHSSLLFEFDGKKIYIDPYSKVADFKQLPKADLILITHQHGDHLDSMALASIYEKSTSLFWTKECEKSSKFKVLGKILSNGDKFIWKGILIEAVPAYNIVNKRPNGSLYHSPGEGNGYILTFRNKRVYVAGDTENIPEMLRFRPIDIAFLPMNLPYTMNPEMFKDAALMIDPKILYPYHFGKSDTSIINDLLKGNPSIEVRLRNME